MGLHLSSHDSFACSAALAEVRAKAEHALQCHDVEEALLALLEVRNACTRASMKIREAADRAKDRAYDQLVARCEASAAYHAELARQHRETP